MNKQNQEQHPEGLPTPPDVIADAGKTVTEFTKTHLYPPQQRSC
jgi:hypothetical protein